MFESHRPDHHFRTRMLLFLHGETEWNVARRSQGRAESPLTATGRAQAADIARILAAHVTPDSRIVSSPQPRTMATVRIVSEALGLESGRIAADDRLMELDLGSFSGLTRREAFARHAGSLAGAGRHDWQFHSPDGETFEALWQRVGAFLDDHPDHDRLIACSHGLTSRLLRGRFAGLSRADLLELPVERGVVYRLAEGQVTRLDPPIVPGGAAV